MRRSRLAGRRKQHYEHKWHYEDQFCRPICKRHGAGAWVTANIDQVTCKSCLQVMAEKGIVKDDELIYTIS